MSPFFGFNKRKNGVVLSNSFICRHCFLSEIISAFQKEALLMSYGPSWLHDSANVFSPRASGLKPLRVEGSGRDTAADAHVWTAGSEGGGFTKHGVHQVASSTPPLPTTERFSSWNDFLGGP